MDPNSHATSPERGGVLSQGNMGFSFIVPHTTRTRSSRIPFPGRMYMNMTTSSTHPHLTVKRKKKLKHRSKVQKPEDVVRKIMSNVTPDTKEKEIRHILSVIVHNEIGVLSRVTGVIASMGFNIVSIVSSTTQSSKLLRMTISLQGTQSKIDNLKTLLHDLVPVWTVLDYTNTVNVEREMVLVKVSLLDEEEENPLSVAQKLTHINEIAKIFKASVADLSHDQVLVEVCAKSCRINSFLELLKPFHIVECMRSGIMVLPRSNMEPDEEIDEDHPATNLKEGSVDSAALPPG